MEKYIEKITEIAFSDKFQKRVIKAGFAAIVALEVIGQILTNI